LPDRPRALGVVVADVSGKGIAAALLMAFLRPVIRSALDHTGDPVEALERTNSILVNERRTGLFVTVVCGVLDLETGVFTFANAGHESPVLARPGRAEPTQVPGGGPLVGVFGRLDLAPLTVEIRPGERLILYTDGIPDAQAPSGERYGEARLLDTIRGTCKGPAEATCRAVIDGVLGFQADADPADDLAFLVLRRLPGS
jgi:sigma-B regulation protein RsbU (phosphoserine phosphatase)